MSSGAMPKDVADGRQAIVGLLGGHVMDLRAIGQV